MNLKTFLAALAIGTGLCLPVQAETQQSINLKDMGSFHIGGRVVEIAGHPVKELKFAPNGVPIKFDPNGKYMVEQMYVQYFIPTVQKGAVPMLMWHGGGLTGVTYETTPDGRPGWLNYFLQKGWAVYNSDAVERGRSGWPAIDANIWEGEPVLVTPANMYERFRIGAGAGSWNEDPTKRKLLPGNQFPADSIMQFGKQVSPRWSSTDKPITAAYLEEVDKVCPCVVVVHSQSGQFGFKVARERPEKVKALIAVEPAEVGLEEQVASLKNVPVLIMYGDFIQQDSRWPEIRRRGVALAAKIREAGGIADVIDLPEAGFKGNSHMVMMDKNNMEIADLINNWLAKHGLYDKDRK